MKTLTTKIALTGALLATLPLMVNTSVRAQETPPPPPGAEMAPPPPDAPRPPAGQNQRRPRRDPAQNRAQMVQRLLERAGATDEATVKAITDYMEEREEATTSLRTKTATLNKAMNNGSATDAEIAAALSELRSAVADEKARRVAAEKELNADIKYTSKPRLEAALTMAGIIGDEAAIAGGRGGMQQRAGGRNGGPGGAGQNRPDRPRRAPQDDAPMDE